MAVQDHIDHVLAALPRWFSDSERTFEEIKAFAEVFDTVDAQTSFWLNLSYILNANGGPPDWLNQHAKDRGTSRVSGESDALLRARIRTVDTAITPESITAYAQSLLDATAVVGTVYSLELVRDRAYLGSFTSQSGTGGTFATVSGTTKKFTPTVAFSHPPYDSVNPIYTFKLVFSGASSAANNGTYTVTGIDGNGAKYINASGVDGADAGVSWVRQRFDITPNLRDGFKKSYFSRGYRMGSAIPTILFIFPYGTTATIANSIVEAIRQKRGAGVRVLSEIRSIP
jgi:hypothetical protein